MAIRRKARNERAADVERIDGAVVYLDSTTFEPGGVSIESPIEIWDEYRSLWAVGSGAHRRNRP